MWIDDQILEHFEKSLYYQIWQPKAAMVVLGSANKAETECHVAHCQNDQTPVYQRYGGGGAVVLYPGCVVISLAMWVQMQFQNKFYFEKLNQAVINTLSSAQPIFSSLYQDGLSDICYQGQKVVGTSLFRSRNYLLYQASLIVDRDLRLINRYLNHPSKEPDYRKNRSHDEFIVGLSDIISISGRDVLDLFQRNYGQHLKVLLGDQIKQPLSDQFNALISRLNKSKNQ